MQRPLQFLIGCTLASIASFAIAASASDDRTIWNCSTSHDGAQPILHLVERPKGSYVKFSTRRFAAHFQEDGDSKAWYWQPGADGFYQFGVILESSGRAWYHNFSLAGAGETSQPLDYFLCNKDQSS